MNFVLPTYFISWQLNFKLLTYCKILLPFYVESRKSIHEIAKDLTGSDISVKVIACLYIIFKICHTWKFTSYISQIFSLRLYQSP
jgi:hypothetical protein